MNVYTGVRSTAPRAARALMRIVLVLALTTALIPVTAGVASAAASLTATPITWGVIGLDSNNVNAGPNSFASGARVCNTGDTAATNVVATYNWTTANTYINLTGQNPLTLASLAPAACFDFYFNIVITRNAAAYDTTRRFWIDVTADGLGTVSTPTPRELYVEHLVSQNRNAVDSITGPTDVLVGNTYTYVLTAHTATQGYPQLSSFLNLTNAVFQITKVDTTYTAPAGATNDTIYGDACGWQPDPSLPNYKSCVGPVNYPGGKVGNTVVTTYTVKIVGVGSNISVYALVYDQSGGSFHYNGDYGSPVASLTGINATEQADLSLTKTDSVDPVTAGRNLTYTMTASNAGPGTATGVAITDDIPAGTSFVSADSGGTLSNGTVTWNVGDIAPGGSSTVHLTVHVNASRSATLSNTAHATTTSTDPDLTNNDATQGTAVVGSADLSITKSDSPDPVGVGQNLTYALDVSNNGPSDATGVSVSDTLPAGVTYVSATPTQGSCSQSLGVITCSLGSVANGGTPSVSVVVRPTSTGSITNTASVSATTPDPDNTNNSDSAGTTVQPRADLAVTKGDYPDPVVAGNQLTYTMVVTNNGPSTATNAVLTDPLPAGTSFFSADASGSLSLGTVTWNLGDLANGASRTVHLVVTVDHGRTANLSNTATVGSDVTDPVSSNDSATQGTTVTTSADLSITKTDSPDPVVVGQNVTYTLSVGNAGPSDALGVSVSDPLPAGLSYVSATPSQGSCSQLLGTVTCSLGTVAAGGTPTVTVVAMATGSGTVTNTASVTSTTPDPDGSNNSDSQDTTITPRADLSIVKTDSPDPVTAGANETYTLTVHNNGPSTASAVSVSDAIPSGTSYVSATPSTGSCSLVLGIVTCSIGDMANGATETVTVVVKVDPSRTTDLTNTASVSSSTVDPDSSNNSSTQDTTVQVRADVGITKTDGADPVTAGTDLTYTIVATDHGPSDATGVTISDTIPAGTSFVSADGGGSFALGTVTWNLGSLASGASQTVHVTVHVDPSRTAGLSNTATVTSTTTDTNAANDSATEATAVATSGDLQVTKSDGSSSVVAGGSTTYTVTLKNVGPSTVPAGAVVTDPVPAGTTARESEPDCAIVGSDVVCTTAAALLPGDSVSWQIGLDVPSDYVGATVVNTASVTSSPIADSDPTNDSATDTDTVATSTDLSVTKTDGADPVTAGTDLTYTIVATNNGPSDATGVSVSDPIPAGTSFVSADAGGNFSAGTVTWDIGALANGASQTLHVTVHVDPSRTTGLSNTATVTGNESDPDLSNNDATQGTTVASAADASVSITDSPDPVGVGAEVTYTLSVGNNGPSDATGVSVSDPIPAGSTYVSATPSQGSCTLTLGTLDCSLGTIAPGATVTITLVVSADSVGTLTDAATVSTTASDTNPANDTDSQDTTVVPVATSTDLSVTKTDGADPVTAGTDLTYTIVATNNGPSDATGVSVSDPIPAGTSFVSADAGGNFSAGTVTWDIGALANGASQTLHVTVHVDPSRTTGLSNTATVTGNESDPDLSNNDATQGTTVTASTDLSVTKTDGADPVTAGTDLTYTIVATNNGPSDATGVSVSDPIPAGTSFVSADAGGNFSAGTVTWDIGALANGASQTLHVTVHVDPGTTTNLSNTATVTGNEADPDLSNNSATEPTTVVPLSASADLSITKTDSADPVTAGTDLTYTLVVTNNGPADATGVTVTDPLPVGESFVSADTGGTFASGVVTWDLGSLANGAVTTLTVTVQVDPSLTTDLTNTASVAGDQADPNSSNDSATEPTAVTTSSDLAITKTAAATSALGSDLLYTITVTNNGPSDATGVVVTDPLPSGATFVSATPTQGSCDGSTGTVTCTLDTVANGATASIDLTVTPTANGDLVNTASVTSDVSDPDGSNNSASATTTIGTGASSADLSIVKTASPDPVYVGADVTYTITVTNNGPNAADGVTVTDPLDPRLALVSADNGGVENAGVVTWDVGHLASGASAVLTLVATVTADHTPLSNTATVTSGTSDPDLSNNQSTVTVDPIDPSSIDTDLSVKKTVDNAHPTVGDQVTYSIVVRNGGPGDATGVVVTDHLPKGLGYVSSRSSVGSYDHSTGLWQLGALVAGDSATLHVKVMIMGNAAASVTNLARITSLNEHDTNGSNDSSQQNITISGVDGAGGSGGTAFTGSNIGKTFAAMLVLLACGFALLLAGRRRRRSAA